MRPACLLMLLLMAGPANAGAIDRIAFGSCADQTKPQPIWDAVLATKPDLFVFLGDNVYGDTEDMDVLRQAYADLAAQPGFVRLKADVPIIATWDDHDFGGNDLGREYPKKSASKDVFLAFFGEPEDSERRRREGIYAAYSYGPEGQRVQVILPDLRTFRPPLTTQKRSAKMKAKSIGPYLPGEGTILGDAQWAWLNGVLKQPADFRVFASSTQVLAQGGGWESWGNFPDDRARLLKALGTNAVIISGDMHWAELSKVGPLVEMTSSGLTKVWHGVGPNQTRVGDAYLGANFGLITIDWDARVATVEVRDGDGKTRIQTAAPF